MVRSGRRPTRAKDAAEAPHTRPVDRQQIIRSTVGLFLERGYHATTMQDIAEEVGILKGSLYHHIRSKEEVLVEMLLASVGDVLDAVTEVVAPAAPAPERLRRVIKAETVAMARHQEEIAIWLSERRGMRDVLAEVDVKAKAVDQVILRVLREGAAAGDWAEEDVPVAYQAIRGMLTWFPAWFRPDGRIKLDEIAERFADYAEAIARAGRDPGAAPAPPH
jgi:AcrR family transcriptional regulator